jgi:hypothetical protein
MIPKNNFFSKMQGGYQKTQILMLISNPLKELKKVYKKKVNNKNVTEKCTFFTFTHACQFVLFLTFVCEIFKQI